jgi:hypothetical protein
MSVRKIIDLNNGAVSTLQHGKHKDAVFLLRTAIADLKERFVVPLPTTSITMQSSAPSSTLIVSSDSNNEYDGHSSHIKVDQKQDKPFIYSVPVWSEEICTQQQNKTSIFMYSQALILADDDHCKELLIGVVFYNMALVNHARAIETGKASLLTAALKFYGMAVAVTQNRNGGVRVSDYWILLAVYNNMAHIYLSRVCSERLCQCLGNIRFLLAVDITEQVVDAGDYMFFVENSLLEIRVDSAPAA